MGLPRALQAHREGDLALAETHYKRALEQGQYKPELFQNYGSLLRANGHNDQAKEIFLKGLENYPFHYGICRNYINLLREQNETSEALKLNLRLLQIARRNDDSALESSYCECIDLLLHLGALQWALAVLRQAFYELGVKYKLLWALFRVNSFDSNDAFCLGQSQLILGLIGQNLSKLTPLERAEFLYSRAFFHAKREEASEALDSVREAYKVLQATSFRDSEELGKAQKLMDVNSWNTSCLLLKVPHFQMGWKLFEHGLRAPAVGRQRWQRHLLKAFTNQELPLWRGEDLNGQRLLLLEEQAIGDTMMFLTLLPTLVEESDHVGIVVSPRLLPICQRSCSKWIDSGLASVWSHKDVASGKLKSDSFDYQSPVGSVCQYRFTDINSFCPKVPILSADVNQSQQFRERTASVDGKTLRIGVSWRGGGRSDRIKLKSIDEDMFADIMSGYGEEVSFVSLQYGDVDSVISKWQAQGLPILHEPSVNPLKNMDDWLNLVASCDAVISVANTTIHGAGGLNVPTMCLLSKHSDWRWIADSRVKRSYWYSSVGIAREGKHDGWSPAMRQVRHWILDGCPMPDGPVHTQEFESKDDHAFVVTASAGA